MKIQCDSCGLAEAEVLCRSMRICDEAVHTANKLSSKHQRVPLLERPPSTAACSPPCDICEERRGYIFCLEDRALLCRNCDVGTHNANPYTWAHRRLLITGVQVALQSFSSAKHVGKMECLSSCWPSSSASPSGPGHRQEEQVLQGNGEMEMDLAASSSDTTAGFPSQQTHTAATGFMDQ
uniref:B box-type domain-containing protein n=1 Tax=Kalanchoe fedtschenkoi TaxID=63787 RepID=A0A7N0UJM3_KALFE